ncbi:hypothetical protein C8A05DRAFT_31524 [Staphylotrichum tortipilum]|uniref:Uncharacterized protein n=1 Tax=Staphylotrichum tortipilum TaxID=2831512 RepID=A0AAN6MPY4_9PEZI|nr:hypothetical protein C8A05DRAFT_31524 [Staphylotrichum longicolle]
MEPTKELKADVANNSTPTRFCFRLRVEDVPGPRLGRSITLANDFLGRNFDRSFSWDGDYLYTPVNIDGEGKAWILLDVAKNVERKPEARDVKLKTFRVKRLGGSLEYEEVNYASIRTYTSLFPWGGRQPQNVKDQRTTSGVERGI